MRDYESSMLAYAQLAALAHKKRQQIGRDKFLILAGAAACKAGWPEVAEHCRAVVTSANPAHMIGRFASFADALRDADFELFLNRLEVFCTNERAEHLLSELEIDYRPANPDVTAGEHALRLLDTHGASNLGNTERWTSQAGDE
jgi:hypothetical protein